MARGEVTRVIDSGSDEPLDVRATQATQAGGRGWENLSEQEQNEFAFGIMRLMMFRNATKVPVKRAELSKYMFENTTSMHGRASIVRGAIARARDEFGALGMDMLEVSKKTHVLRAGLGLSQVRVTRTAAHDASQTARLPASQSGAGATTRSKAYILVSTLPQEQRVETDQELRAFLAIVASLIVLSPGCRISEEELKRYLVRACGIYVDESRGNAQLKGANVKELLEKKLVSQWYLEREKEEDEFFFYLGPRIRAELSDEDLLAFIDAVFVPQGGGIDLTSRKELQERLDAARGAVCSNECEEEDE